MQRALIFLVVVICVFFTSNGLWTTRRTTEAKTQIIKKKIKRLNFYQMSKEMKV